MDGVMTAISICTRLFLDNHTCVMIVSLYKFGYGEYGLCYDGNVCYVHRFDRYYDRYARTRLATENLVRVMTVVAAQD